jgi:hypothetical protein
MKILVVGFPRSGTTLTYRIFETHPQVEEMNFEKYILLNKSLMKSFTAGIICGGKVTYEKRVLGKIGKSTYTIVDYCQDWNKLFKDEARIVQIIRHPLDSLNSLVISKKRFKRGPSAARVYKEYLNYMATYTLDIDSLYNCLTIKYENLITNPEKIIKKLYEHCGLDPIKFKEKMKTKRVFNYKHKDFLLEWDDRLEEVIDSFNLIKGIKYEKS